MAEIERKLRYAASHAPDLLADLENAKDRIEAAAPGEADGADQSVIEQNIELARLMGVSVPDDLDPEIAQHLFGERRIWQDRLKRAGVVEKARTIGYNAERFLDEQRLHQKPATHDELANYLKALTAGSGLWTEATDVAS